MVFKTKSAKALGVTKEGIENFSEEVVFTIIGNTYNDNLSSLNYNCNFNPLDKLMESYEENRKLYERLLKAEQEKIAYLEKLMKEK